jgi:sugar phosphate isomerase/epimerase
VPADEFNRDMERDFVLKHLSPFVEHATKKGVTLAVENMGPVPEKYAIHRYCQNPDEICEVADALGTRVCWDFGHANMAGLKQSESLRHIGSRLAVLHVNDNFGGDDIHLPPFKGNIDWCDAMKGLTDIGFDGLFNFEISADKVPFEMRESFACYLIDSARKIMSYSEA